MIPIKTIIRNKTATSKTIHWAGKETKWLPANGETTVPFEIWSVANDSQKSAIKFALSTGAIELSIMVLGSNGEYSVVPFNPLGKEIELPAEPVKVLDIDTTKKQIAEIDHTVRVVSTETMNVMEAYGAKPMPVGADEIMPTRELKNGEPAKAEETPVQGATVEESKEEQPVEEQPAEPKKRRTKKAE